MADSDIQHQCSNPQCQVAQTGTCAEGHEPLTSCPNIRPVPDDDLSIYEEETGSINENEESVDDYKALPSGEALLSEEVETFLLWRPAVFVTIIGDSYSGKTTMICSLYDRLLRGEFCNFSFAGSRTLVAFEKCLHYSRIDSGRKTPETPRTAISEGLGYFHLGLRQQGSNNSRIDLLFSHRAGEPYDKIRSNLNIIPTLPEITKANIISLLLDGGRLVDIYDRNNAIQSVRQTLRALIDSGSIDSSSIVQIITTKLDLVNTITGQHKIRDFIRKFQEDLIRDFSPRLLELSFWEIAARDPTGELKPAHGLGRLLEEWTKPRIQHKLPVYSSPSLKTEFDCLLERTPLKDAL